MIIIDFSRTRKMIKIFFSQKLKCSPSRYFYQVLWQFGIFVAEPLIFARPPNPSRAKRGEEIRFELF